MADRAELTRMFEADGESSSSRDFLPEAEFMPGPTCRVLDVGGPGA